MDQTAGDNDDWANGAVLPITLASEEREAKRWLKAGVNTLHASRATTNSPIPLDFEQERQWMASEHC
jgi:hypothetical protein